MNRPIKKIYSWYVPLGAIFCCALWGLSFPCMGTIYRSFPTGGLPATQILLAGIRFAAAGGILLLFSLSRGEPILAALRRRPLSLAGFGLLQTGLQYGCFYLSMSALPSGRASLINTTNAFLSVLLAHFFCAGDRLNRNKLAGCALGFLGILLLSGDISGNPAPWADVLMLLSALSFSAGNIVCQRLARHCRPVPLAGWQMLFGGGALTLAGILGGGSLRNGAAAGWLLTAFLIAQSAAAFSLWNLLLSMAPVSSIGIYTCLIPVVGVFSSLILPDEPPLTARVLGVLALCVLGVVFVNMPNCGKVKNSST